MDADAHGYKLGRDIALVAVCKDRRRGDVWAAQQHGPTEHRDTNEREF
jgi:hypothetical protein